MVMCPTEGTHRLSSLMVTAGSDAIVSAVSGMASVVLRYMLATGMTCLVAASPVASTPSALIPVTREVRFAAVGTVESVNVGMVTSATPQIRLLDVCSIDGSGGGPEHPVGGVAQHPRRRHEHRGQLHADHPGGVVGVHLVLDPLDVVVPADGHPSVTAGHRPPLGQL